MDPVDFHDYVIKPTLDQLGLDQPGASFLLLGTALVESGLDRVRQIGGGPALGVYQMEPATHDDLWQNWLAPRRPELARGVERLVAQWPPGATQLMVNNAYATAMARCLYARRPEPLPAPLDLDAHALYWKTHFNTFQPEQTHNYITAQLRRFVERFPKELLEREDGG